MRKGSVGHVLIVALLLIVLTKLNRAEDRSTENGGPPIVIPVSPPADTGDRNADSLREVERMKATLDELKLLVARRLRECQGLPVGGNSDIAITDNEDGSYSLSPAYSRRKFMPPQISRVEEEWMVLAGELHAENCVELLLNRISDPSVVHLVNLVPHRQGNPAFYFLCKLGSPAYEAALRRIPLERDAKIRRRLTKLLLHGHSAAEVRLSLMKLNEECDTDEVRERVQAALEQLDEPALPRGG